MKKLLILLIDAYQAAISPFMGHCCRYYPTCSEYAKEAIHKHGVLKGCSKAARRVLSCHPFSKGGYNPP